MAAAPGSRREHDVVAVGGSFIVCRQCGAYSGGVNAVGLRQDCPGPLPSYDNATPNEKRVRRRRDKLMQGLHPKTGKPLV